MEEKTLFKLARAITDTGTVQYQVQEEQYQSKNIIYYGK